MTKHLECVLGFGFSLAGRGYRFLDSLSLAAFSSILCPQLSSLVEAGCRIAQAVSGGPDLFGVGSLPLALE